MDEVTWIEVLPRHREHGLRQRIHADALTVGRAWDNDIVLDDAHVAAHHLRIARDADGRWIAEDLDSVNGLRLEGERRARANIVLAPGTTVHIGHTSLRLHRGSDAVPAELPLGRNRSPWPAALACCALVLALAVLELWLGETTEPKLVRYLTGVLALAAVALLWTSAWAAISRLFAGPARFGTHLLIASAGLLAYSLYDPLGEFGAFALSWTAFARYAYVGAWILLGATCFAHLRALSRKRLPLKAIAVAALAALGIGMQSLKLSDWRANYGQPAMLQRLAPPWLRVAATQEPGAFFAGSLDLQAAIDAARADEPGGTDDDDAADD
jgi:hypothetical protein